jgi:tetratricopeptide (TPR) repeat protein
MFRIIAVSVPILFLALLELSLWLFHYGPDLSLFSVETMNGKQYYTLNPSVKNRYFSRINFSPDPSPEYFLVTKPPGTYRIFCLGGSTTVGYPYWYNGAFASFLRDRLTTIFPDRSIEVVNLGITATNSFTVLDISNDLMDYAPDLVIVYDGHNEFYGVLGAASNDRVAPARWMTLFYLRMIHLRTFQLAKNSIAEVLSIFGKSPIDYANRTTMMEQVARGKNVPLGNDVYTNAYRVFQANLHDLADRLRCRHIPLILSTQVSSIRDQNPFISNHSSGISQQHMSQVEQFYRRGLDFQSNGMMDSAITSFRSGIELDSLYADAHYRLAQCLDAKGKKQEAYSEYILARDYDELRFRTDSKFNDLIRSMDDHQQIFVADIELKLKALSPDSLIGRNLIFEHLHPTSRGHFFMAKEYVRLMCEYTLLTSADQWKKCDTVTDAYLWEHRHVTDVDEFLAQRKTEFLVSSWPFQSRSARVEPIEPTDTLRYIADLAAHNQIGWDHAHRRAAEYYFHRLDFRNAGREYETIFDQLPLEMDPDLKQAQSYYEQMQYPKAETILLASFSIRKTASAYRLLGDIKLKQGQAEKAVLYYEALNTYPINPSTVAENSYMLAIAYLFSHKSDLAIHTLETILERNPAYRPAHELLLKIKSPAKTNLAP